MLKLLIFFKMLKLFETCLYLLAPGPGPGSGTQFVFTGPGLQLVLPALALNLCLLATVYKLLPVRGLSLHIPTWSPQFVFVFTALAYDLYYWSRI